MGHGGHEIDQVSVDLEIDSIESVIRGFGFEGYMRFGEVADSRRGGLYIVLALIFVRTCPVRMPT